MRTKLTITSPVETKKTSKDKPFYTFKAKDGDKEFNYFTFSQTIGTTLVQGVTCEAEIEEKEHTGADGTVYKNRTVNQVWIDGKPIREEKKSFSGRGKSPEEIASMERTSLWRGYCDIKASGGALPKDIEDGILNIARNIICSQGGTQKIESKEPAKDDFEKIPSATKEFTINTIGDLFTLCNKNWKMTRTEVLKELGITDQKQIGDLSVAYLTIKSIKEPK